LTVFHGTRHRSALLTIKPQGGRKGGIMKKSFLVPICVLFLILFSASSAWCIVFDLPCERKLYLTGHIDQYARYGLQNSNTLPGGGRVGGGYRGLTDALYSFLFEVHYIHSDMLEFRVGTRLEGDWAYAINHSQNSWNGKNGFDQSEGQMKRHTHNLQRDFFRECNLNFTTNTFSARLGKQTVVWGETDLFRLMDMFNPLDYQRIYVLRDADYGYEETRIPLWAVKLGYQPDIRVDPFTNLMLEFAWTPEVRQTLLNVGPRTGGPWAVPIPHDMPDLTGLGLGTLKDLDINPGDDHGMRGMSMENSTYGIRLRGNWGNTYFTINGFHAWDEFPIFQTRPGFVGNLGAGGLGILYGVGGPFGGTGGNVDDGFGYGMALDKRLYRKDVVGFTLAREMDFLRSFVQTIGQVANPTVRVESYYQFDKHIATRWAQDVKEGVLRVNDGDPDGFNQVLHGIADGGKGYKKRDVLRYMVGFDWPLRLRYLNPRKEFFTSFQFTQEHIFGSVGDRFYFVPYTMKIPRDKMDITFLANTEYFHEKVKPQYAMAYDINHNAYMPKFSCRFWLGDHWRPEIGYMYITGHTDRSHAWFKKCDNFWAKLQYQW